MTYQEINQVIEKMQSVKTKNEVKETPIGMMYTQLHNSMCLEYEAAGHTESQLKETISKLIYGFYLSNNMISDHTL